MINLLLTSMMMILSHAQTVKVEGSSGETLATVVCAAAESQFQMERTLHGRSFAVAERRSAGVLLRTEGNEDAPIPAPGDVLIEHGNGCVVTLTGDADSGSRPSEH